MCNHAAAVTMHRTSPNMSINICKQKTCYLTTVSIGTQVYHGRLSSSRTKYEPNNSGGPDNS